MMSSRFGLVVSYTAGTLTPQGGKAHALQFLRILRVLAVPDLCALVQQLLRLLVLHYDTQPHVLRELDDVVEFLLISSFISE